MIKGMSEERQIQMAVRGGRWGVFFSDVKYSESEMR